MYDTIDKQLVIKGLLCKSLSVTYNNELSWLKEFHFLDLLATKLYNFKDFEFSISLKVPKFFSVTV